MTGWLARGVRRIALAAFGHARIESALARVQSFFGGDAVLGAYRSVGILNYETPQRSGEQHLIDEDLPRRIRTARPVLVDAGANRGEMSLALRKAFPQARIVAFEPNPPTFELLRAATAQAGVECVPSGLGAQAGRLVLHSYRGDPTSGHATAYADTFRLYRNYGVAGADDLVHVEVPVTTLDAYCSANGIEAIDFLKIDVEGHELQVLRGAHGLLERGAIGCLQFEFTECNVWSRTFLRDFYELLPGFSFHRLLPSGLLPLGEYAARNEIFQYQNILAVREGAST